MHTYRHGLEWLTTLGEQYSVYAGCALRTAAYEWYVPVYKALGVSMLRRLNQDLGEPPRNGALLAKPRHGKIAFKKTDSPPRVTCIVNAWQYQN